MTASPTAPSTRRHTSPAASWSIPQHAPRIEKPCRYRTDTVGRGQFVSIVGPSGSGKSTVLRIIDGFEAPTDGSVTVDGEPVTEPGPDQGTVFQNNALFPWRTVSENVAYGLEEVDPPILLMDEPFGSVDARTKATLHRELLDIWTETGETILFVTHDIEEAVYLSDRIVVFSTGPGTVLDEIPVPLERPRDRTGDAFTDIKSEVLAYFEDEED